jgi:uncharacterized BrkB/YihY/UPF0761 family membrane protein
VKLHTVTLGGTAVGAALLIGYLIRWWFQEKHRPSALVPFTLSTAYGMLLILSGGGLLGGAAGVALWGSNTVGDGALKYGVGGTTGDVTRAHAIVLTPGGYVVVLLTTVALIALWRWAPKVRNWKIAVGLLCGICLALSGTLAGAAAVPLGNGANLAGLAFTEVMAK